MQQLQPRSQASAPVCERWTSSVAAKTAAESERNKEKGEQEREQERGREREDTYVLDLLRSNILALAQLEDVLLAVNDAQVAVSGPHADVTTVQPAVSIDGLRSLLLVLVVADEGSDREGERERERERGREGEGEGGREGEREREGRDSHGNVKQRGSNAKQRQGRQQLTRRIRSGRGSTLHHDRRRHHPRSPRCRPAAPRKSRQHGSR